MTSKSMHLSERWSLRVRIGFLILVSGCLKLDNSIFNQQKISSYVLSNAVIPDSARSQVVMISQGNKIYGYFVRSNGLFPQMTVLYNHGNRDHLQFYWDRVELFYKMGFNVFIYDYQGYGMSEGEPSETGMYADAQTAFAYVSSRSDVNPSKIAFYGFSLGCAAAVDLAATTFTPCVLILEAPFASSTSLVQSGTLLDIPGSYVMKGNFDNAGKIKAVHAPLLIMHGEDDTFLDVNANAQVIFDNANKPKVFIHVPGANHSEVPWKMGQQKYIAVVDSFVVNPAVQ